MSDLYKEALADAAKIREVAEQDAKNSIMEKIAPYIKQMIVKESSALFQEQEQEELPPDPSMVDPGGVPASAALPAPESTMPDPTVMPSAEVAPVPDPTDMPMPITPSGGEDMVNVPMTTDGKITLSFDDLFTKDPNELGAPGTDGPDSTEVASPEPPVDLTGALPSLGSELEAPVPETALAAEVGPMPAPEVAGSAAEDEELPPEGRSAPISEIKSIKSFEKVLAETALNIDKLYSVNVSDMTKNSLKNKLFSLLEQLDYFKTKKVVTEKQAQLNENRLEFLFLHLKEANVNNTYNKKKDTTMTTLKDFAAKLFESSDLPMEPGDSQSTGTTGMATHKKATEHAKKASGVHANLFSGGDTLEIASGSGTVDADALEGLDGEEGNWEEALMEEIQKEIVDSRTVELDESALRSAVRNIRLENAAKKSKLAKRIAESAKKKIKENLELSVELPSDIEDQLDADDLTVDLQLTSGGEEEEEDLGDEGDEDLELGGDEEDLAGDEEGEEDLGGEEETEEGEEDLGGDEEEEMILTDEEEEPITESRKVRRAMRLAEASQKQTRGLKKEMVETNLFLAKLVYLNKFLVREDLNRKVKQQIVEHLDRAKTTAEAKVIYGKINKKLDEAVAKQTAPVVGSASKPTTAGSARLNESATRSNTSNGSNDEVIGTYAKWQILSGIKKSND